jgi:hypothetical protein
VTGNSGPSGGCHLDLRINVAGNTNPQLETLVLSQDEGAPALYWSFVNPEAVLRPLRHGALPRRRRRLRPGLDGTELPIR